MDLAQQWRNVTDGANTLDVFYTSTEKVFDSLIQRGADAQDEIDSITNMYSEKRKFYVFDTTENVEIGETVKLTYPRFGLDSGVNLLCLGKEIDFIENTYRITLWG